MPTTTYLANMKAKEVKPTDLNRSWQVPYAARLGSSVRSKGIYLEVRARLPASAKKALSVTAGELTLSMTANSAKEFEEAVKVVDTTLIGIESLP